MIPADFAAGKVDAAFQELHKQLLDMMAMDLDKFCQLAGVNKVQALVCIDRSRGLSWGQIAVKYEISRSTAQGYCKKCTPEPDSGGAAACEA